MTNPAEPPPLDVAWLVEVLERYGVEYLLVGGVAAQAHGARRPTTDFDCLTRRTRDNLDRLAEAMRELHARLRAEGLDDEEAARLPVRVDGESLARMEISTWRTDAGDLDILADIPDRAGRHVRYDELAERAVTANLGDIAVRVAALEDVIASKEWANRPKDREALPELRALSDRSAGLS
ncbi:MAG: nucleotidyl transferase AbiEii/AbiGii toxin family protein [Acidimicrobiales bacterium]